MIDDHFDLEYYRRYYEDLATSVVDRRMQVNEVRFVLAFCRLIDLTISRFVDIGAGTGWWKKEFLKQHPAECDVETFDASLAACERYGHRHVSVQQHRGRAADLVVCRDVLRYVPDSDIGAAINSLARKCRGVLYVQAITRDDAIDESMSDTTGCFRTAAFYRRAFKAEGFRDCGMGLFVSPRLRNFQPWALDVR